MMAFLSGIFATIMSFFSIFGGIFGFFGGSEPVDPGNGGGGVYLTEAQCSEAYQNGSWDGSWNGIAEVKDGILYYRGKESSFPADSSLNFKRDVIVSTPKGTWFIYNPSDKLLVLTCDYRGEMKFESNLSAFLDGCVKKEIELTDDGTQISCHFIYKTGAEETILYNIDYEQIKKAS